MFWSDLVLVAFLVFAVLLLVTVLVHLLYGVPYVPTPHRVVKRMLEIANPQPGDRVYDLGCGDGRLIFAAEKITKVGGVGYELAPIPYLFACFGKILRRSDSRLYLKSLFTADLSQTDVLFCYLMPHMLKKLSKKITTECRKGTKIVSHGFKIEGLTPKRVFERNNSKKMPTIYFYEL